MEKDLSGQLSSYALKNGITLIGYTDAEMLECMDYPSDLDPLHFQPCTVAKVADWCYDPKILMPQARSIVVTALYTYGFDQTLPSTEGTPRGKIGPWTRGYWEFCRVQGEIVSDFLKLRGYKALWTNFLPYKTLAVKAGMGKIGNNGFLYTIETGSYLELSAVLTDAALETLDYGTVSDNDCGKCGVCIQACPTKALKENSYDFDLCLHQWLQGLGAYKGNIPPKERVKTGEYLERTGRCLEVCPRNANLEPREHFPVKIERGSDSPELLPLVLAEDKEIRKLLPYHVHKYGSCNIRKNAIMALGNIGDPAAVPVLVRGLQTLGAQHRGLCAWSLGQVGGQEALDALEKAMNEERDLEVLGEIHLAMKKWRVRN